MNTWLIFRREVAQFFTTPFAYFIGAALLVLTGLLFSSDLYTSVNQKAPEPALIPAFLSFAMILIAPLITMRLLAEESNEGTLELLLTAPVRDGGIVVGKFLSAWFFFTFLLALTFIYQIIVSSFTEPDIGHIISAYLGIWLYGGATLSIGLFFSALTSSQIIAAFGGMTALLLLWLTELIGQVITGIETAEVVRNLSLPGHFIGSFALGFIRGEDVVYFVGVITIMLFATIRVVEARRWQ